MVTTSGLRGDGLDEVWEHVEEHRRILSAAGDLEARRRQQLRRWMWSLIEDELVASFRRDPRVAESLPELEDEVVTGKITATLAARRLLETYGGR